MYQYVKAFLVGSFLSLSIISAAQNGQADYNINSPYSRIGIGDLAPIGNVRNLGMGGTGVSHSHPEFFNPINPALLINNRVFRYDSLMNILDGAIYTQLRNIKDEDNSQLSGAVNYSYFNYALPINRLWTTAIGLRPLSDVSFFTQSVVPVTGSPADTAVISFSGSGGLNEAFLSNAIRLTPWLNVGVQTGYVFGSINRESFSYLRTFADSIRTGYNNKTFYSGFHIRPGISFRKALERKHRDSAVYFNAGFMYEFFAGMDGTESLIIERRSPANLIISREETESVTQKITMPSTFRSGISLDKYGKWNYALDFSFTNWKNAKGFSSIDTLGNSFTIAAGAEWAIHREKDKTEEERILKRKFFRAGISFTQTPLVVEGRHVNDLSFSLGCSFPVGRIDRLLYKSIPRPKLNLALVAGQRGSVSKSFVKDQYLIGYVGVTINDKWFRKRRIE